MLEIDGITKSFDATIALDGVSLRLGAGEVHALVGENGAGKSTLMNVLAGKIKPDAGAMRLGGKPYAPASAADARRAGLRLVHQELALCPHLTVAENILLGAEPASRFGWFDERAARRRAAAVLESFGQKNIAPEAIVGALPLPAQQVVEICRAAASDARLILMDEPTSSLPRADVERLFELIRRLRDEGKSIIYISHFLEEVREIADSFTVLRDGRSVETGDLRDVTNEELIRLMVGRRVEQLFPSRRSDAADYKSNDVLLEVRDLQSPPVLRRASFTLRRGEILGIAGLMGAGRTEMVRALFGLDAARAGTFNLKSQALRLIGATPSTRIANGIGYLSEDRKGEGLALPLSIADNMTLTNFEGCARGGWLRLGAQSRQAGAWMRSLGVKAASARQPVAALSGGNQQKVAFARLLHQDAEVLLLDEPTRGVDIGSKQQIYEVIARLAAEGRAVLMVSSYLPELFGMCDRLAVMSRGNLSEAKPIAEWTPEAVMRTAVGGAGFVEGERDGR